MSQWKNIGPVVALSITTALAGAGCMAQGADDNADEPEVAAAATTDGTVADPAKADEKTGEADQACGGFFGGWGGGCGGFFGGWGGGCFGGWGGCGLGLGFGFPFFGGWGGGCFGGWGGCGGFGLGGFGGCW